MVKNDSYYFNLKCLHLPVILMLKSHLCQQGDNNNMPLTILHIFIQGSEKQGQKGVVSFNPICIYNVSQKSQIIKIGNMY